MLFASWLFVSSSSCITTIIIIIIIIIFIIISIPTTVFIIRRDEPNRQDCCFSFWIYWLSLTKTESEANPKTNLMMRRAGLSSAQSCCTFPANSEPQCVTLNPDFFEPQFVTLNRAIFEPQRGHRPSAPSIQKASIDGAVRSTFHLHTTLIKW